MTNSSSASQALDLQAAMWNMRPQKLPGKVVVKFADVDELLAAALRGQPSLGRSVAASMDQPMLLERIDYHGIAGLLNERPALLAGWDRTTRDAIRSIALGEALWELRHGQLVSDLISALARAGIASLLLKGSALAYDLYPRSATRSRGDTDLLVAPEDVPTVRKILSVQGFRRNSAGLPKSSSCALQEGWHKAGEGPMEHHVDLHWQILNAPALREVLNVDELFARAVPLPRLGPDARAIDRVSALLHACVHRTMHVTSPYFVKDRTYYGGNRFIWLYDIHLLANTLDERQWEAFATLASDRGIASACRGGLTAANKVLGTAVPIAAMDRLGNAPKNEPASRYLSARQFGRAWQDFCSISGLGRKFDYVRERALPEGSFMRDKYPHLIHLPLAILHARRLVDLVRARPQR